MTTTIGNVFLAILLTIMMISLVSMFLSLAFPRAFTAAMDKIDQSITRWIEGK